MNKFNVIDFMINPKFQATVDMCIIPIAIECKPLNFYQDFSVTFFRMCKKEDSDRGPGYSVAISNRLFKV